METIIRDDKVVISGGPFIGYEGVFDASLGGKEYVRVLLKLLKNRHLNLEIPENQVQLLK